ncbi:CrcB family protein [Saccharothrix xinjiangensis]|uniref:Fluoride-specific ion channel FluC n=1 Tax=Saccharothrix xinjiangensis TaxID=204798 RepID=A0ABV9YB92_9PSEU
MTTESRVVAAVALGGGLGGAARYGVGSLVPGLAGTLLVNVVGCALIGVLVVLAPRLHPLARPFLGVGVLGGFTTFSACALGAVELGDWRAVAYLALSVLLGLSATAAAAGATRRVVP